MTVAKVVDKNSSATFTAGQSTDVAQVKSNCQNLNRKERRTATARKSRIRIRRRIERKRKDRNNCELIVSVNMKTDS